MKETERIPSILELRIYTMFCVLKDELMRKWKNIFFFLFWMIGFYAMIFLLLPTLTTRIGEIVSVILFFLPVFLIAYIGANKMNSREEDEDWKDYRS